MKSLKNVAFESLECFDLSDLGDVLEFIDALISLYRVGGKPQSYTRERCVALAVAAVEAGVDPGTPYVTEQIVSAVVADLDCLKSCQWDAFQESHAATEEARGIMAEWELDAIEEDEKKVA